MVHLVLERTFIDMRFYVSWLTIFR